MGEYRFNWHDEVTRRPSFKEWLIPTLLGSTGSDREKLDALAEATQAWTDVNVTVQINGIDVDPEDFFDSVERNLSLLTADKARELVDGDERLRELSNSMSSLLRALRFEGRLALGRLGIDWDEEDY